MTYNTILNEGGGIIAYSSGPIYPNYMVHSYLTVTKFASQFNVNPSQNNRILDLILINIISALPNDSLYFKFHPHYSPLEIDLHINRTTEQPRRKGLR